VEVVRNRGARVIGPSPRALRDLADVRAELEGYAAALAAERIRDDQLEQLRDAWRAYRDAIAEFLDDPDELRRRESGERWMQANERFHGLVLDGAGNRQIRISIEDLQRRMPRNISYAALSGDSRLLLRSVDQHELIVESIANHDAVAARTAMSESIRGTAALVARYYEDQVEADR
jgi:DNA-binding GntR family transcriptional regulator